MNPFARFTAAALLAAAALAGCDDAGARHADHDHDEVPATQDVPGAERRDEHDHTGRDDDKHDQTGRDHDDHDDHDEPGIVRLPAAERSEFGVRVETAAGGSLRPRVSLAGEVVLNPDRVAHVVARAGGIGTEVRATVGSRVEAGETLAVLESPGLAEAKADYLARASQAALAATDLERAKVVHANTIQLLDVVAQSPGMDMLGDRIGGLDIGANRGALITTYAELKTTEAVYKREKTLFGREISSESEYLAAESAFKKAFAAFQAVRDDLVFANRRELDAARRSKLVADVALQAAERKLHALGLDESEVDRVAGEADLELSRHEIRAPISGRIIERHLVRGESVAAGDQVFVVADLSSVWAHLTLYQRDLGAVVEGARVRVVGTHDLVESRAEIVYVSPILDEHTRTTTARVVLDNAEGHWRPGMFVRADVLASGGGRAAGVVVPRAAVQEMDGAAVVFVETAEGLVPRPVTLGRSDAESVEITAGLAAGERYVAAGGLAVKAELNRAALEHAGHGH